MAACTGEPPPEPLPPLPERVVDREPDRGEERPIRELTIALTGEVRGEVTPCGCPTTPFGGFERRECFLRELAAEGAPLIQLDAGEALLKGLTRSRPDEVVPRAKAIGEMMALVGVQAFAPGPADLLALGVDGLQEMQAALAPDPSDPGAGGVQFISATWTDPSGAPLFPRSVVVAAGGIRVGVVGLSGKVNAPEVKDQVGWVEPEEATRLALAELPPDLDLVVGLGSLGEIERFALAETQPALAAILGTRGANHERPRTPSGGGPLLIEVPSRGRYVSALRLQLGSTPERPLETEDDLDRRADLRRAIRSDDPENRARQSLDALEASLRERGAGRNLVDALDRPLGPDLDGCGAATEPLLAGFREEQLTIARAAVAETPEFAPHYATSAPCVACHARELARWSFTAHARAYQTLLSHATEPDGGVADPDGAPSRDPECLGCHTTGFGEPGGFAELDLFTLRKYQAVQCEACHGQLAGHPERADVQAQPITPATCVGCHDDANSPNFDYATYLPMATCQEPPGG